MAKLYSVYDKRAREYGPIMQMPTDAHAVRAFTQEVNRADAGNNLNQFPEDFVLMRIADFDTETAQLSGEPEILLQAEAAMRPKA